MYVATGLQIIMSLVHSTQRQCQKSDMSRFMILCLHHLMIKTHGSESHCQENRPCDSYQESFTRTKNVKKWMPKLTFLQLKSLPYCCHLTISLPLTNKINLTCIGTGESRDMVSAFPLSGLFFSQVVGELMGAYNIIYQDTQSCVSDQETKKYAKPRNTWAHQCVIYATIQVADFSLS